MRRQTARATLVLAASFALPLSPALWAEQAQPSASSVVAKFENGDPGWKVRMEAMVQLARTGPDAVPALIEALQRGSPTAREFAAQALVLLPDPAARPALEKAVADTKPSVRVYAIHALSMLGPLTERERFQQLLKTDPNTWGVKPMIAAALARTDTPDAAGLRKALADYDLGKMASARVGELAPDFTLLDAEGKPRKLSEFRGKSEVVLRFILFDF